MRISQKIAIIFSAYIIIINIPSVMKSYIVLSDKSYKGVVFQLKQP